jgi:hypothetical protein
VLHAAGLLLRLLLGFFRTDRFAHGYLLAPPAGLPAAFKVLNGLLVLLGLGARWESAKIAAFAGSRIYLSRIEPVLPGFEFADHGPAPEASFAITRR